MTENIPISDPALEPSANSTRFRVLVTGVDDQGRSRFVRDGLASHRQVVADTPSFVSTNIWRTLSTPVVNSAEDYDDGFGAPAGIAPPIDGSVLRILEFPPDSEWTHREGFAERMMHATPSLDYAIVLSGEIWSVLDVEERRMQRGDVLVQRGTLHAWSNRSESPALVAFVLIGGNVLPE